MLFFNLFHLNGWKGRLRPLGSFNSLKHVAFTHFALIHFLAAVANAQSSALSFSIDQRGVSSISSLTQPSIVQPLQVLHARLLASAVPAAYAYLRYNVAFNRRSGVYFPIGSAVQSGRIYGEVSDASKVGVAISNEGGRAATVSFYLTDAQGANIGAGTATIPPNRQITRFLDQDPFNALLGHQTSRSFGRHFLRIHGRIFTRFYVFSSVPRGDVCSPKRPTPSSPA